MTIYGAGGRENWRCWHGRLSCSSRCLLAGQRTAAKQSILATREEDRDRGNRWNKNRKGICRYPKMNCHS